MPAIPCPRHPDGATDLTPPEEHVLHDVGLCRDDSEVSKAWRGHRVPVPMISQVESSLHLKPISRVGEKRLKHGRRRVVGLTR